MDHVFSSSRGSGVLLFDEDFDLPPADMEPEIIQPVFTAAELIAAREEAARDARDIALADADASARSASRVALTEIAGQLTAARAEVVSIAEQSSEAIARLLLDCFASAFPALSARHGSAEAAAVMRAILPTLHREPKITVRVNPHLIAALTEEMLSLDADLSARVRLIPTDAMAVGDARVNWENGAATRDTASLWGQIENILGPAGLLDTRVTTKEQELVE